MVGYFQDLFVEFLIFVGGFEGVQFEKQNWSRKEMYTQTSINFRREGVFVSLQSNTVRFSWLIGTPMIPLWLSDGLFSPNVQWQGLSEQVCVGLLGVFGATSMQVVSVAFVLVECSAMDFVLTRFILRDSSIRVYFVGIYAALISEAKY